MACLPYPTFLDNHTSTPTIRSLYAVGRMRIHPSSCPGVLRDDNEGATSSAGPDATSAAVEEYRSIVSAFVDAASSSSPSVDNVGGVDVDERRRKMLIKEGTKMAISYLRNTLGIDASIIDVEVVLCSEDVIETDGLLASSFLDAGCDKVVIIARGGMPDADGRLSSALSACDVTRVPRERLVLHIKGISDDVDGNMSDIVLSRLDEVISRVATISLQSTDLPSSSSSSSSSFAAVVRMIPLLSPKLKCVVQLNAGDDASYSIDDLRDAVIRLSGIIGENGGSITLVDPTCERLGSCYAACMKTDRMDGLYPTVVCTRNNEALGLVYSNVDSIIDALRTGRGVYYSRSRGGLWRKGDTSGHHQTLHRFDADCDADALRFTVTQNGGTDGVCAFCHLNTLTCWGEPRGMRHLECTLLSRYVNAPPGSYTKRLFDDTALLRNKLVEEAQELSEAETKEHVAEELADVLYFAMVRAVSAGVGIDDAVAELDRRARKVTRRQGDSKAYRIKAGEEILAKKGGEGDDKA